MPKKRQNEAKKQDAPKTDIFEDVLNNDTKSSSVEQKPASRVRSPSMQIFAKCWPSVSKTRRMCFFYSHENFKAARDLVGNFVYCELKT